jgi:hypothetical protein
MVMVIIGKFNQDATYVLAAAVISLSLAGCSGSSVPPSSGLPTPPAPSNTSAYIGSEDPGYWTFITDDTQKAYVYQQAGAASTSGNFAVTSGLLDLGNANGVSLGKATEQAGATAFLRPGDNTAFPIPMTPQSDCFAINGKLRYIYTALPGQAVQTDGNALNTGYGTFVVSTSGDGTSWSFEDLHNYVLTELTGGSFTAGTENGQDPESFAAACKSTNGLGTISADASAPFPSAASGKPAAPTFHFHSAGSFVEDRSTAFTWMGFAMPAAPISVSDVISKNYSGFAYENNGISPVHTRPVIFAQLTGTSVLTGGDFANDDLTQTPGSEYTLALGQQDSALNGVFPNASFTAYDTYGTCGVVAQSTPAVQPGFDANGNAICTAAGVAVVAQVDGKYVLYFTTEDGTSNPNPLTANHAYLIQFYLYQQ